MTTKRCSKCGELKSVAEFSKDRSAHDGLQRQCKLCKKAHYREWRAENREQEQERNRQYYEVNPEYNRQYYIENREQERERIRQWNAEHPDEVHANGMLKRARRYGATVVEKVDRREVFKRAAGLCGICHEPVDPTAYEVDHVIALSLGGEHSYANTQLAHPVCNRRKGAAEQQEARAHRKAT